MVSVGLYVLNLGSIDLSNGAFDADFYLYLTAEAGSGGRYDVASDYESYLPNAGSNPRVWVVSKLKSRTNLTSQYRMKGKFYFEPDGECAALARTDLSARAAASAPRPRSLLVAFPDATSSVRALAHPPLPCARAPRRGDCAPRRPPHGPVQ